MCESIFALGLSRHKPQYGGCADDYDYTKNRDMSLSAAHVGVLACPHLPVHGRAAFQLPPVSRLHLLVAVHLAEITKTSSVSLEKGDVHLLLDGLGGGLGANESLDNLGLLNQERSDDSAR